MSWLVLGSSATAPESLRLAKRDNEIDGLITCNRGLDLVNNPDVYALICSQACPVFVEKAKQARSRGTLCVTLRRKQRALETRGVHWFDVLINEGHPWQPFQMSGLWCVEYAIRVGLAWDVILCGMDGYAGAGYGDYFTEEYGHKAKNYDITASVIQPATQALVDKYPDVKFRLYGQPNYRVEADNWTVIAV